MHYKYSLDDIQVDETKNVLTNITRSSFRNNTCFVGDWIDILQETEPKTLKFKINNLSSPSCFFIGLTSNDKITNDLMVESDSNTYAYCGNGRLYHNNRSESTVDDCQHNDVLQLTLDPKLLSLRLTINNANEILLFDDIIARKYRFAISLCFAEDSLSILHENITNKSDEIMGETDAITKESISPTKVYKFSIPPPPSTDAGSEQIEASLSLAISASDAYDENQVNIEINDNNDDNNAHAIEHNDEDSLYDILCVNNVRREIMYLSIFIMSSFSFSLWFNDEDENEAFAVAHILCGFGSCLLCIASIISFVRFLLESVSSASCISFKCLYILLRNEVNISRAIFMLYFIASLLYFIGGCIVTQIYSKYNLSHYSAIWFAQQTCISFYGIICGFDVYKKEYLDDKKVRIMVYCINSILLSIILFFGFAVCCYLVNSAGAILLATFYFFLIVINSIYLLLFICKEHIANKARIALILSIMHFLSICGVFIGYCLLTKQVFASYKAYFIGFAFFILLNGASITFDMRMNQFNNNNNNINKNNNEGEKMDIDEKSSSNSTCSSSETSEQELML